MPRWIFPNGQPIDTDESAAVAAVKGPSYGATTLWHAKIDKGLAAAATAWAAPRGLNRSQLIRLALRSLIESGLYPEDFAREEMKATMRATQLKIADAFRQIAKEYEDLNDADEGDANDGGADGGQDEA